MENRLKMMKKVGFLSICIMIVVMLLSLFFKDKMITFGVGLGCMIGLIGFNMILQWGYSVETGKNPRVYRNFLSRYAFYAIMFGLCYYLGANVLALLVGFMCHKLAVFVYSITEK